MDLSLETIDVWEIQGDLPPRDFLPAIAQLLSPGDIAMFGCYEPTPELEMALAEAGASRHDHLEGFFMCFYANRSEHPNGCAFRYTIHGKPFEDILRLSDAILSQKDIPSFYDHFVAYRPGIPQLPLISFHDAAYGGTLYLSGHYTEEHARTAARSLSREAVQITNPILSQQK